MLIVKGEDVRRLLAARELDVLDAVAAAYSAHAAGQTSVPHSLFLCFPDDPASRIIALPAYLGGAWDVAGMKWISSFPGNVREGLERASAVMILNSARTGHPEAILEGSVISSVRTAASAALAARTLSPEATGSVGIVGCGLINYQVVRFLRATRPDLARVVLFDLEPARAEQLGRQVEASWPELEATVAGSVEAVLREHALVSIATTAATPHIMDLSLCRPGAAILHVSLRDIDPRAILAADNVVDDADHVDRAETSIHLASRRVGHRDFIRCTLGEILTDAAPARAGDGRPVVFSPFGLGILDVAVACLVRDRALAEGAGLVLEDFVPRPWAADRTVSGAISS